MMTDILHLLLVVTEYEEQDFQDVLSIGAGVFALILFSLSLYSWLRRKRFSLLVVAIAFLLFFLKSVIQFIPEQSSLSNLIYSLIDFVFLAMFFLALVLKSDKE